MSPILSRTAAVATSLLPFLLGLYAVLLSASFGRPLWIDEFSHFAYAAEPTAREAWSLFLSTADNIQHGQTGVYIMLNYWTIALFGPDATALRLPSIMSGLFLFASTIMLFRVLGFSVLWQVIVVAALSGQHVLMYFVGEARAYAPIPAAAAGLLLYYVARPLHPGSRGLLVFGIVAAVLGATMHAYFALYWPMVCVVAYLHHLAAQGQRFSVAGLVRFANPGLVALGSGLYLLLAALTWLRGHPVFDLDPFEWISRQALAGHFTNYSHAQFLGGRHVLAAILTAAAIFGLLRIRATQRGDCERLWAPCLLILLSFAASMMISGVSYLSSYWILSRQWVGSIALIAIGTVWLWAEAARLWSRQRPVLGSAIAAAATLLVSSQAANFHHSRFSALRAMIVGHTPQQTAEGCAPPGALDIASMTNDHRNTVMVHLANRNISCGGAVWPIFRRYYNETPSG